MAIVLCPYCGNPCEVVDSAEVYDGRSYGLIHICRDCDAYVGCHRGTDKPLGTPANAALRGLRRATHRAFDPCWTRAFSILREPKRKVRNDMYAALAELLGIPVKECHIAMFDESLCTRTMAVCNSGDLNRKFATTRERIPPKTN